MSEAVRTVPRGAEMLVRAMQRAGVRCVFSLSGNHIMPVYDALIDSGIRLIHTRHEAAAVHMADAWGRLTGEVGVALVTGGPGHANAVSALYTALMADSPVLLLSGHAPADQLGMGPFQEMRQAEMAAPVCKASWTCAGPDAVAGDLARAFAMARAGRPGPVHLSLPSDALEGFAAPASLPEAGLFSPVPQRLAAELSSELVAWLTSARHPLVLCGPQACTRVGRAQADALRSAMGVPVIGMESPRGVADPALGAWGDALARADAVLLLGKRLDFTLKFGRAPFGAHVRWAQVDADDAEIDRSRRALEARLEIAALADFAAACEALSAAARPDDRHAAWCAEVDALIDWRPAAWAAPVSATPGRLHPLQALQPIQALLDSHPDAVFVCDGGEIGQWAQACLRAPQRLVNGVAGSIGSGLPFALAARCALPADVPVVAVSGDGSIGFHLAEFDTGVRHELPAVVVVGNDARWNAEYQIQLKDYGADRLHGCELAPTRYEQAAAGLGAHGERVERAEDLADALARARASGRVACVNVMIEGLAAPQLKRPAP